MQNPQKDLYFMLLSKTAELEKLLFINIHNTPMYYKYFDRNIKSIRKQLKKYFNTCVN